MRKKFLCREKGGTGLYYPTLRGGKITRTRGKKAGI